MVHRSTGLKFLALALQLGSTACDPEGLLGGSQSSTDDEKAGDTSASDDRDDRDYPDAPEGSCNAWKYAYCDAIVACSAFVSREQCELDLGWLVCKESAPLGKCQQKIERALEKEACEDLPKDCGPSEIADRTLVTELCENIHTEMCEFRFFCGLEFSTDACMDSLSQVEPCGAFTSFLPTAVDCAEAYSTLGCEQGMPPVCAGSLRY